MDEASTVTDTTTSRSDLWTTGLTILIAVLCVIGLFTYSIHHMRGWFDLNTPQDFGAAVGAVGGLFSALAFAGLVATIVLQSRELKLQREELAATRAEFKDQNRTMARDLFERGFFQLLMMHRDIARGMEVSLKEDSSPRRGLSAFRGVTERIESLLRNRPAAATRDETVNALRAQLDECCFANHSDFSHYFNCTESLLAEIQRAGLKDAEAQHYSALLRSQLTEGERCVLLAYAATTDKLSQMERAGLFGAYIRPTVRAFFDQQIGANPEEASRGIRS